MEATNEEELKKLDERLAEAEKIESESDAWKARANYLEIRYVFCSSVTFLVYMK